MAQWPEGGSRTTINLARTWTGIAHPTRIADLCANGLLPRPQSGLTTFFVPGRNTATELTCSLKYVPGASVIDNVRLVALTVTCLFLKLLPVEAVAFCKCRWDALPANQFWVAVKRYLEHSISMPPCIQEAAMIENPTVRTFVLASWYRLSVRSTLSYVDEFLSAAAAEQWTAYSKVWGPTVCRHLKVLQTPFVVTTHDKADFVIEGVGVKVPLRDKVAVVLLMMFAVRQDGAVPWGERRPGKGETPIDGLFLEFSELYEPKRCWVHECLAAALALNPRVQ